MKKHGLSIILLLFGVVLCVLFMNIVRGTVGLVSPGNNTNHTNTTSLNFTVQYDNATLFAVNLNANQVSMECFYNGTTSYPSITIGNWSNSSGTLFLNSTHIWTSNSTVSNISNITNGVNYVVMCNVSNGTAIVNSSNSTGIIFDFFGPENVTYDSLTLANGANQSGNITINVTASDSISGVRNITIYVNGTLLVKNCTSAASCYWTNATINGSTDGSYVFNATIVDWAGNTNISIGSRTIRIDTTTPENMTYAPATLAASANQSGNLTINITATDAGSGVKNISIFVNGSLVKNCTSATECYWSNASADGSYIFNATAEDYAANKNVTIGSRTIKVDTTAPTASLDCSPSSVPISQSITCTCTATDATSGVRNYSYVLSTSTSSSASQDTSVVGTFTETCTINDYAGNPNSATASYSTTSGSELPGGGGIPSVLTYNLGALTEAGTTKKVKVDEKVKFVSEEVQYTTTIDEVTSTTAKLTISSQTLSLNIGDVKKLDLNDDDVYDTSITLTGIAESKAELTFKAISEAVTLPPEEEVEEELCGNDIVDEGENCENCPADVKCASDEECKAGVCEKKEVAPPKAKLTWLWIILGVLVVIGIVVYLSTKKKK